jgi:ATP-dependent DNA ligase
MSESAGCPVRLPVPLMLARPIRVLPDAPGAVYEAKLDGVRAVYGAGRLWSRHRKQLHVPEVIAAARGLGDGVVLDGELVVFAADGRCDFPAVCRRLHSPAPPAVTYVAFDLLAAAGRDLRAQPTGSAACG